MGIDSPIPRDNFSASSVDNSQGKEQENDLLRLVLSSNTVDVRRCKCLQMKL